MSAPAGARCAQHVDAEATHACGRCGDFLCEQCIAARHEDDAYCDRCAEHAGPAFPWEARAELGLGDAIGQTLVGTLLSPGHLFSRGFRDRSIVPAMAYGAALSTATKVFMVGISALRERDATAALEVLDSHLGKAGSVLLEPLFFAVSVSMLALAWWVGLRVVGHASRPLSHVVRALAYVLGATSPLSAVLLLFEDGLAPFLLLLLVKLLLSGAALAGLTRAPKAHVAGAGAIAVVLLGLVLFGASLVVGLVL